MNFKIIKSNRKTISLSVDDELNAIVKAPYYVSNYQIQEFIDRNSGWLEKAVLRKKKHIDKYNISEEDKKRLILEANDYLPKRVEYYSDIMNVKPTGLKITSAKKRFGSCNRKNSICFSLYLMQYPQAAIDYVVVHELCHIRHHDHSPAFYRLVESVLPDYKERERLLRR